MNKGRFWIASLAGGVTLFIVGFLVFGLALAGFYEAHAGSATGVAKESMDFFHLALGQYFFGLLLTVIIGTYAKTSGFGAGLKIGAAVGLLAALSIDLTQFSMTNLFDLTTVIVDPLASVIWSGLGGGVVGLVLGDGSGEAAA